MPCDAYGQRERSMGGLAKLLLKIVINNRGLQVFVVVNNCEKIEDYLSGLKN